MSSMFPLPRLLPKENTFVFRACGYPRKLALFFLLDLPAGLIIVGSVLMYD